MADSSIEWTRGPDGKPGKTWNPLSGCTPKSPGCLNCYAIPMAYRLEAMGQEKYVGTAKRVEGVPKWTGRINFDDDLGAPLRWTKPKNIFVNSMSDLFHEKVPFEFIDRVLMVCAIAKWHTFQILTKRIERALRYFEERTLGDALANVRFANDNESAHKWGTWTDRIVSAYATDDSLAGTRLPPHSVLSEATAVDIAKGLGDRKMYYPQAWPLPNVLIGPSIEDQIRADERMPIAAELAAMGWRVMISAEPLLEPIRLGLTKLPAQRRPAWLVIGGESGPNARESKLHAIRALARHGRAASVPVFIKQLGRHILVPNDSLGEWPRGGDALLIPEPNPDVLVMQGDLIEVRTLHKKGGDPNEWPADLRIQEPPRAAA